MKKLIIHTPTQKLYNQVLEKLERETDLRWLGSREKPTEYNCWNIYKEKTVLRIDNIISYGALDFYKKYYIDYKFITAEEFLNDKKEDKRDWKREKFEELKFKFNFKSDYFANDFTEDLEKLFFPQKSKETIIKHCLQYCKHRLQSHPEAGIKKVVSVDDIKRALKKLN